MMPHPPLQIVIIDNERGRRRLNPSLSKPTSLIELDPNVTVIEWIRKTLAETPVGDITYIGGYQLQKMIARYPMYGYRYHQNWQDEGELKALRLFDALPDHQCLLIRAGTLFGKEALESLRDADSGLAAGRYRDANGVRRFVGLVLIAAGETRRVLESAAELAAADPKADLELLLERISGVGWTNLDGLAAPLDDRDATARISFRGKAGTLAQLSGMVQRAVVSDQLSFTTSLWEQDPASLVRGIVQRFAGSRIVVRSSSGLEDQPGKSHAGRFESVLDVDGGNADAIGRAVRRVVASLSGTEDAAAREDEVLVQKQIENLSAGGVLLTRTPGSDAPYFVLNIDRGSGLSNVVTSGSPGNTTTYFVSWYCDPQFLSDETGRLIELGRELVHLTHYNALDIEFGIDAEENCHLFQVRPLNIRDEADRFDDADIASLIEDARGFVASMMAPCPGLHGATTVFGNMPDWNPAEMIGAMPRPLALSLYQHLVGRNAWAQARSDLGYRDQRPHQLIFSLAGRPYVDVRASLNSLTPADLAGDVADRWIDDCLARLVMRPELHDKIEFELTATCLAPDWEKYRTLMRGAGLSPNEIDAFKGALARLTQSAIEPADPNGAGPEKTILELSERRTRLLAQDADTPYGNAIAAQWLLSDCERLGVVPFAVFARLGFMALAWLYGLREAGILSAEEVDIVLSSIPTVAGDFATKLASLSAGEIGRQELLAEFGHLRPNSYDITSPNYASNPDRYLSAVAVGTTSQRYDAVAAEAVFERHRGAISNVLKGHGLSVPPERILEFIRSSIGLRERSKFEFMKNLDAALVRIERFGAHFGLSPDDLSYLNLEEILRYSRDTASAGTSSNFRRTINYRKKRHGLSTLLEFPDLITHPDNLLFFEQETWRPNFVGHKAVIAQAVMLEPETAPDALCGRIVLIEHADPGYDWIFGRGIVGLVTAYGGVGSHMAIRAAEFALPAAIGCGTGVLKTLSRAGRVRIDCINRIVRPA